MKQGTILNLTQHEAMDEQVKQGVIEPDSGLKDRIRGLLTFDEIPSPNELIRRAEELADLAYEAGADRVLLAGAPYFKVCRN